MVTNEPTQRADSNFRANLGSHQRRGRDNASIRSSLLKIWRNTSYVHRFDIATPLGTFIWPQARSRQLTYGALARLEL